MFANVLAGVDGSSASRQVVETAPDIAAMSGGTLHIAMAREPQGDAGVGRPDEYEVINACGDVDALLQELSFIATQRDLAPVVHAGQGDPAAFLIKTGEDANADLIVVGNHAMRGVRRVLGSVPNSVAHGAHCSVLIVDTTE